MRTNPEMCRICKHGEQDPGDEPCWMCVSSSAFEDKRTKEERERARLREIDEWLRRQRCSGGNICYCAPFEEEDDG